MLNDNQIILNITLTLIKGFILLGARGKIIASTAHFLVVERSCHYLNLIEAL